MRVVLTRPAQDARGWAEGLRAAGHEVVELPLIAIGPAPDVAALRMVRDSLSTFDAAMFVSANAVRGLFASGMAWPAGTRAWATGPGTRQALADAGVPEAAIDAPDAASGQFDSEALWPLVEQQARQGAKVLLVRGADRTGEAAGRNWLHSQLLATGARVETVAAYSRLVPDWPASQQALARGAAGAAWLFSSSEAIANLRQLLPGHDWSRSHAVATHERIAQAAREAGFGVVHPSRPGREDVVAALESLR